MPSASATASAAIRTLDLGALAWTLSPDDAPHGRLPARVPGCVASALQDAGVLGPAHAPGVEADCARAALRDWTLRAEFDAPAALIALPEIDLVAERLDAPAEILLNGSPLGALANSFRVWRLPVRPLLRPIGNRIEVRLRSPLREIEALAARPVSRDGVEVHGYIPNHAWLRRMACGHGWDWGPALPTSGLGALRLEARAGRRLVSVAVAQHHAPGGGVSLALAPELAPPDPSASSIFRVTLSAPDGAVVHAGPSLSLAVPSPRLWWPNGLGEQPLYTRVVELLDDAGLVLDAWTRRLGLRTLRLVQDPDPAGLGRGFGFEVNGRPVFAKGANWIPVDLFHHRVTSGRLRALLSAAAGAHMNMLRVWGGGIY